MNKKLDWSGIDTVLLDMDGTLIDQHHEDVFWEDILPEAYAKKNKMTLEEARKFLFRLYETKGPKNIEWGSSRMWEKELNVGFRTLRRRMKPYIKLHPHTLKFLRFLNDNGKKVYLVSAADRVDVDIEVAHTKIGGYIDSIFTTFDFGATKHYAIFWKRLRKKIRFNPERTVLAEDNENIARVATKFGIKYVVFKSIASSKKPPHAPEGLFCVRHFDELLPANRDTKLKSRRAK